MSTISTVTGRTTSPKSSSPQNARTIIIARPLTIPVILFQRGSSAFRLRWNTCTTVVPNTEILTLHDSLKSDTLLAVQAHIEERREQLVLEYLHGGHLVLVTPVQEILPIIQEVRLIQLLRQGVREPTRSG
jgi:hypothetical protein